MMKYLLIKKNKLELSIYIVYMCIYIIYIYIYIYICTNTHGLSLTWWQIIKSKYEIYIVHTYIQIHKTQYIEHVHVCVYC